MAENSSVVSVPRGLRIAFEGCGHGELHNIYAAVGESAKLKGWDGVDVVIIGGDFQAVRNAYDMSCMSVPQRFKQIGDFHEYYSGQRTAPYLTLFIGGNHEASNHLFELYYGGWVAPNIYYMGAANVIRCGPLRIAGLSGIWKGYDYRKPHFERLPYNRDDVQSIYHVRELDIRKLLQIRTQVDLCLSHDWPRKIEYAGDFDTLFRIKRGFEEDSRNDKLGSLAAKLVLDRLRPRYWFSAHLHVKFVASLTHGSYVPVAERVTKASHMPDSTTQAEQASPAKRKLSSDSHQSKPTPKAAVSAWNNFHEVAERQDAADFATYLESLKTTNMNSTVHEDSEVTWRKVGISRGTANDSQRQITSVEKTYDDPAKNTGDEANPVKNTDEIDLDLESESDDGVNVVRGVDSKAEPNADSESNIEVVPEIDGEVDARAIPNTDGNVDSEDNILVRSQADAQIDSKTEDAQRNEDPEARPASPGLPEEVPEDLRSQLPASFSRPTPNKNQSVPPNTTGDIPEAIKNSKTEFLALDKCLPGRHFLQLVEYEAISDQNSDQSDRPFRLQYDKEWLAITRVFADDLVLGDPTASVPPIRGEDYYRQRIEEQEQWVEENVPDMTIPENFVRTAPTYDPAVPITTLEMPPEYNNPQTQQFCDLLAMPNKLYLTEKEQQERAATGPRPEAPKSFANGHRGHRGPNQRGDRNAWRGFGGGRRGGHRGGFRGRRGHA